MEEGLGGSYDLPQIPLSSAEDAPIPGPVSPGCGESMQENMQVLREKSDLEPPRSSNSAISRLDVAAEQFSQEQNLNQAIAEIMAGLSAVLVQQEKQAEAIARLEAADEKRGSVNRRASRERPSRQASQEMVSMRPRGTMTSAVDSSLPAKEAPPRQVATSGKEQMVAFMSAKRPDSNVPQMAKGPVPVPIYSNYEATTMERKSIRPVPWSDPSGEAGEALDSDDLSLDFKRASLSVKQFFFGSFRGHLFFMVLTAGQ